MRVNPMKIDKIATEAPVLRKMADKDKWAYAQDWESSIKFKGFDGTITAKIKAGYWTDLASVPRALRGAFDNGSGDFGVLVASQWHDMFYSTHFMTKEFADELFYGILRYYGMGYLKAKAYYWAVKLFGDDAWEFLSPEECEKDCKLCDFLWGV